MAHSSAESEAAISGRARQLAWEILQKVEDGGFADVLLGHGLERARLRARDAALATRLVYTTLSWQLYLDHLLQPFSRQKLAELDPPIRCLLRLAMTQVALLTKVPVFAAVNTSVDLAKQHQGGRATGYVNAVLRKAVAGWREVPLPPRDERLVAHLSVRWSHPRWLVERWLKEYGESEIESLLAANNGIAPTAVRINRLRTDLESAAAELRAAGLEVEPSRYSPLGLRLTGGGMPHQLPGFREGRLSTQGEASQLVGYLLAPQPGQRVLDLCAAPGGKSLHAAELMENRGEVVARDVSSRGVANVRANAERLGLTIVRAEVRDAIMPASGEAPFDRVLVDAPCSGLGTLRAHPELKWRRQPDDCAKLAALQRRILENAAGQVADGGMLVYATCTMVRGENDEVIAGFLAQHPDFSVSNPLAALPEPARPLIDADHRFRSRPDRHDLDGFFAVRLRRR